MGQRTGEDRRARRIAQGGGGDFTSDPRRLVNVTKERRIVGRRRRRRKGKKIYRAEDGDERESYTRNYYTLGDRRSLLSST